MRFVGLTPRRFYLGTFANGVGADALSIPYATEDNMKHLERTLLYSIVLKASPGRSEVF